MLTTQTVVLTGEAPDSPYMQAVDTLVSVDLSERPQVTEELFRAFREGALSIQKTWEGGAYTAHQSAWEIFSISK